VSPERESAPPVPPEAEAEQDPAARARTVEPSPAEGRALKPHERLPALLAKARANDHALREAIDALIAMRAPGDESEEARVLLQQLDADALDTLFDESGRDAKAEAVETLLSLGFPYALHVRPQDLEYLRREKPDSLGAVVLRIQAARSAMLVCSAFGLGGLLGTWSQHLGGGDALPWALATFAGAGWLRSRAPQLNNQAAPVTLVGLGLLGEWIAALTSTGTPALLGAAVGSVGLLGLWAQRKWIS
jgi:hypothetical protein